MRKTLPSLDLHCIHQANLESESFHFLIGQLTLNNNSEIFSHCAYIVAGDTLVVSSHTRWDSILIVQDLNF